MSKIILTAIGTLALASQALAAYNGPLLSKSTHSGFVRPGYRIHTSCEIYSDKVVLKLAAENNQSTEERKITLQGDLSKSIEESSRGPIESQTAPVDGPGTYYKAFRILSDDGVETIDLATDSGGNGKRTINRSDAAQGLRNFIDMNCK